VPTYFGGIISSMKEISIFVRATDLEQVTEILRKHNVCGMTFYDIYGAVPAMAESYMTGRTIIPDYVKKTKVETIASDYVTRQIVDDISDSLSQHVEKEPQGMMIFVKDVSDAYEIGTRQRQRRELVLTTNDEV
jgi:nitrogen regulatory protein PII